MPDLLALHSDVNRLFFDEWTRLHTMGLLLVIPVLGWIIWKAYHEQRRK